MYNNDFMYNSMDYNKDFDTRAYLVSRYPATFEEDQAKSTLPWNIQCYHRFYETFKEEWDNSNAVLVQLGAGPCIWDLISAAPYVAEIYHSDYLKSCCDEVLLWKNKDPNAYDWSPYFTYVVNTLEGKGGPHAVVERETMLCSILKDSFTCNVQQIPLVLPGSLKFPDIVCTNFCLEVALPTKERYISALKEIFQMLKPKGFFVMLSSLECTHYIINGIKFLHDIVYLKYKDIEDALQEVGFTIRYKESKEMPIKNVYNDVKGQAFFVAQKVIN